MYIKNDKTFRENYWALRNDSSLSQKRQGIYPLVPLDLSDKLSD